MKEEEIEKGDCAGAANPKVFFWDFVGLEDGPVAYPAGAFDSYLRGD